MLLFHLAGEGTATRWLVPVVKFVRRSTIINGAIVTVEQKNERGLGPVTNPTQTFFGSLAEKLSSRDKTFFTSKVITKFLAPLGKDKTKEILDYCLTPTWKLLWSWSFCMISAIRNTSWICIKENWLVMSTDLSVSYSRYSSHDMSVLGGGLRELLLVVWEKQVTDTLTSQRKDYNKYSVNPFTPLSN